MQALLILAAKQIIQKEEKVKADFVKEFIGTQSSPSLHMFAPMKRGVLNYKPKEVHVASTILSYLDFETIHGGISLVSSGFHSLITKDKRIDQVTWRVLFTQEFRYLDYPDHAIQQGETYRQYFIRSFKMFKQMRGLLAGIINETNTRTGTKEMDGFLRPFSDRISPKFAFIDERITFQIECLYKSFRDRNVDQISLDVSQPQKI